MSQIVLFSLCLASLYPVPFPGRMYVLRSALACTLCCSLIHMSGGSQLVFESHAVLVALFLAIPLRASQAIASFAGELLDSLQSNALGGQAVGVQTAGGKTPCSILGMYVHGVVVMQAEVLFKLLTLLPLLEQRVEEGAVVFRSFFQATRHHMIDVVLLFTPVLLALVVLLWTTATFSRFCRGMSLLAEISVVRISLFWIFLAVALRTNGLDRYFLDAHIKSILESLVLSAISLQ